MLRCFRILVLMLFLLVGALVTYVLQLLQIRSECLPIP